MKRTKRLLALVLAMMMALSIMAVTAAAYDAEEHNHECAACCEDEGIMPLGITRRCTEPGCSGTVSRYSTLKYESINGVCPLCGQRGCSRIYQCECEACNTCSFDREISRVYLRTTCAG